MSRIRAVENSPHSMRLPIAILSTWFIGNPFAAPQVTIDYGTFQGSNDALTGIDNFLGIPFAQAGRLENPVLMNSSYRLADTQDATKYGSACPQSEMVASPLSQNPISSEIGKLLGFVEALFPNITDQSEVCLSINVQVPQGTKPGEKLPVLMWIFGGGYEVGSSAAFASETTAVKGVTYQGANLVARSVQMNKPIVFVSANYRVNAFGGLASQEITDAGIANLHLKDQRVAMQWVQKYISQVRIGINLELGLSANRYLSSAAILGK